MYQPLPHRQEQLEAQHALIRSHPLGLLISHCAEGLQANSIPFLIDPGASKLGTLQAHMARANGQWRSLDAANDVLVVFQGADHYITPGWYETKRETGKVVPTWNYVTIHAYGTVEFFSDTDRLLDIVTRLTNREEGRRTDPWAVTDAPPDFIDVMLKGIVGFAMPITRLEGKWKMSQNRPAEDRVGVIAGLAAGGRPEVADLVSDPGDG
jgi:transcriptional regulator